jgi:predicted SAM-dependent methyltransferase
MVADVLRLRSLEARLRRLQREYYTSSSRDRVPEIFAAYSQSLAEARTLWASVFARSAVVLPWLRRRVPRGMEVKLHLGCGDHILVGWYNVDMTCQGDLCAKLAQAIPVRSAVVDFIHTDTATRGAASPRAARSRSTSDFLEHIELEDATRFLGECFRVFKPGGVMRLLTPDLRAIVERVYLRRDALHLRWCHTYLNTESPCEALNMHMRMDDHAHRFVYDYELLSRVLRDAGFRVRRVAYNRSRHPQLRYLDLRDFGLNLFIEAAKP